MFRHFVGLALKVLREIVLHFISEKEKRSSYFLSCFIIAAVQLI